MSELNLITPQLGVIDWLALVVEIEGPGWKVTLLGSANVEIGPPGYLASKEWIPDRKLYVISGSEDRIDASWVQNLEPLPTAAVSFGTGPVSMAWQFDSARSLVAASTRPRRVGDTSRRVERWYAETVLGRPVKDGRGRKPREHDEFDNWIKLTEKAMDLKRRNPSLTWVIIAEAHIGVSLSTLSRWRDRYDDLLLR